MPALVSRAKTEADWGLPVRPWRKMLSKGEPVPAPPAYPHPQEALLGSGSLLQLSHTTARADPDIATLFAPRHLGQHCVPVEESR